VGSLRVEVLGRVGVRHAGAAVPLGAKATALVCYLALDPRPHPRPTLAGPLWGDLPEQRARANLRMVVAELRKALGDHVEITPTDIAPEPGWQLDVTEWATGSPGRIRGTSRRRWRPSTTGPSPGCRSTVRRTSTTG
jgi:hypothetical protein